MSPSSCSNASKSALLDGDRRRRPAHAAEHAAAAAERVAVARMRGAGTGIGRRVAALPPGEEQPATNHDEPTCSSRPRIEAKPPMPPKKP